MVRDVPGSKPSSNVPLSIGSVQQREAHPVLIGLEMAKNDEAKWIAYRRALTPVGIVCRFFVYIASLIARPSRLSVTSYVLVETKFSVI